MASAVRSFRHSSTVRDVRFWNGKDGREPRPLAGGCTMKYRADIDGRRAPAIIPVLFYHVGVAGFAGGFVGVDIFLVISGDLICGMIDADIRNDRGRAKACAVVCPKTREGR
jgi:hypothetical protein